VVKVRLSGERPGTDALIAVLASNPAVEIVTGPDGPYPNRREPGERVYLTVRIPPYAVKQGGAAHSRQAIRCPAATHASRRQLP
jgi:hypothetical protein